MKVIVTGGTGFIGLHLVRALQARGDEVVAVGRRVAPELPVGVRYEQADVAEGGVAHALIATHRPDSVFHLASAVDTGRDLERLDGQLRDTLQAAIHVARACLSADVERLVHVGTCEEYGNGAAPFRESQAVAPVSPYSAAKAAATSFVRMLCASFGLRAVVVRPFLTYGPGQPPRLLIPALIRSALAGRDFPMTAGEQTREFNYVEDIVDGLLQAASAPDVLGQIINIGCGEPHRIRDVAALVLDLMERPITLRLGELPYRPGETWQFYCDNSKARSLLGWQPRTSLDDGLRRTIGWYRQESREVGHGL